MAIETKGIHYYEGVYKTHFGNIDPKTIAQGMRFIRDAWVRLEERTSFIPAIAGREDIVFGSLWDDDRLKVLLEAVPLVPATDRPNETPGLEQMRSLVVTYATNRQAWDQIIDRQASVKIPETRITRRRRRFLVGVAA